MRATIYFRDQTVYIGDTEFQPSEDVWESIRTVLSTFLVRSEGRLELTGVTSSHDSIRVQLYNP